MAYVPKKLPGQKCTPPAWSKEDHEVYGWCINHGITISAAAEVPGMNVAGWWIDIQINNQIKRSPRTYGIKELWPKVFELYKYYHDKYNK